MLFNWLCIMQYSPKTSAVQILACFFCKFTLVFCRVDMVCFYLGLCNADGGFCMLLRYPPGDTGLLLARWKTDKWFSSVCCGIKLSSWMYEENVEMQHLFWQLWNRGIFKSNCWLYSPCFKLLEVSSQGPSSEHSFYWQMILQFR